MNILVVDDHPIFIDGISHVLRQLAEHTHIVKANSVVAAIDILDSNSEFDLVLLDLNMPNLDGVSMLHRFQADELCTPVVIVSSEEQAGLIKQTLDWGAMGFVPKSYSAEAMIAAFQRVLEGHIYIPETVQCLLNRVSSKTTDGEQNLVRLKSGITNKQFEVLGLLAKGLSNEQIALMLHRTEHTVKSHVAALFQILGANSRTECVNIARQRGLIEPTK